MRILLETPVRNLFPKPVRAEKWLEFCELAQLENLTRPGFWSDFIFWPNRVEYLVKEKVFQQSKVLREQGKWINHEVRELIRMIISDYTGGSRFSDDDEFVRDLGLD